MQRTRIGTLIWAFLFGAPIGWLIAKAVRSADGGLPPVPVVLPILLVALAVSGFIAARWVRGWVDQRKHERHLDALRVARLVAMAKAGAVFGAFVAGGYTGMALMALSLVDVPLGRNRLVVSAIVVVAALLVTVAALVLERACEAPPPPDDEESPTTPRADPSS